MALQKKTFSVGDFTRNGKTNGYILDLILTEESTSVVNNTSLINYVLQLRSGSSNRFTSSYFWCKVNIAGQEKTAKPKITAAYNHTYTLLSGSVTVSHDADGSFILPWSASMGNTSDNQYAPYDTEFSGTMALTKIPRASTISAAAANIGENATIVINRKSNTFTHSIAYQFGGLKGYINEDGQAVEGETKFTNTTVNFSIPESFYGQIPEDTYGVCVLSCKTYSGTSQIGYTQECSFKAKASEADCVPIVSGSVEDINPVTLALTGDAGKLVRFYSIARCIISAEARNCATIVRTAVNGTSFADAMDIANVETNSFYFQARDTRGYMGETLVPKTFIPYVRLTANPVVTRNDPTSGNATLALKGDCYKGSFGAVENEIYVQYRINGGEYVALEPKVSDGTYSVSAVLSGLDYTSSHTIEVEVSDKLAKVTKEVTVNKGIPVFDWGENDFAFHVPVSAPSFSGPVSGVYLRSAKVWDSGKTITLQTRFAAIDNGGARQTIFLFGGANATLLSGVIGVDSAGKTAWTGTDGVSIGTMDSNGQIIVTLPVGAYDVFALMSAYPFEVL